VLVFRIDSLAERLCVAARLSVFLLRLKMSTQQTESPTSLNTQNFADSDDDILDNFAEGPQPGDAPPMGDTHDDGVPMGLGSEGKQPSDPADSTLESDISTETPSDETIPSDDSSATSDTVPDEGETVDEEIPSAESEEPTAPEFSPVLLQMAGYADAEAAKADGFGSPEALHAFIRGRNQLLTPEPEGPLYGRSKTPEPSTEEQVEPEITPFKLPEDKLEVLDEDLVDVLQKMNEHYQQELQTLRQSTPPPQDLVVDEVSQFDQEVQNLGEQWHDTFGTGPGTELSSKAGRDPVAMTNFRNRDELFDAVQTLRDVNSKKGMPPMTLQQEIQYALMQRHPDKFQQTVSEKPSGKARSISRPTQRRTPPKTQNDKTLSAVNRMLAKKGRPKLTADPQDDFDGEI
jgi:hypothetical protein